MPKTRRLRFCGEAAGHAAAVACIELPGDTAIDRRGTERAIVMKCPDGCGDILTINLDSRSGKAWRLDRRAGQITVFPSVWRDEGCRAHFIVWRDNLIWGDSKDEYKWHDERLIAAVLSRLTGEYQSYVDLAEALNAIPWEASWACGELVRRGEAEVKERDYFRSSDAKVRESTNDKRA